MLAEITRITFHWNDNFVTYNDTDLMTDYFHSYSLGQKETANWINESGADNITVHVVNNDKTIPAMRRIKQICKRCGYKYEDKSHMHHYEIQNVDEFVLEYELTRLVPSMFIVSWWKPELKEYEKSEAMSKENAEKLIKVLRANKITSAEMRRVPFTV